jgi:DNA-binding MarR family transcriptional regulator
MKEKYVDEMRAFSRFYTDILGLLDNHILESNFSLPEVRILYELYHHSAITAKDIILLINIDKGQLSRILEKLEKQKLLIRKRSKEDGRATLLSLSARGIAEFEILNKASHRQVFDMLKKLKELEVIELIRHMKEIQRLLS